MSRTTIALPDIPERVLRVRIVGTAPLVCHEFGTKTQNQIKEAAEGTGGKRKRAPKDSHAEYLAARHRLPDGRDGFPAAAVKRALETVAADDEQVTKTALKWQLMVHPGEGPYPAMDVASVRNLVPILNLATGRHFAGDGKDAPEEYVAYCRVGPMKVADVRTRPLYRQWAGDLAIVYRSDRFRPEAVLRLLRLAGRAGIQEERPSAPKASGTMGTFDLDPESLSDEPFVPQDNGKRE